MNLRLTLLSLIALFIAVPMAMAQEADIPTADPIVHIVQSGDNLNYIASQYSTTAETIALINNIESNSMLFVDQPLTVTGIVPLPDGVTLVDSPSLQIHRRLPFIPKWHIVQGGESIASLSEKYKLDEQFLRDINLLPPEANLELGQDLLIPNTRGDLYQLDYIVEAGDTVEGIANKFNTAPEYLFGSDAVVNRAYLVIGEKIPIVSRTGSIRPDKQVGFPHLVQAGDTIASIASQYRMSMAELARINQVDLPTTLLTGQQLFIPQGDAEYRSFPNGWKQISILNEQIEQGDTVEIYVESSVEITPTGRIEYIGLSQPISPYFYADHAQDFPFFPVENGWMAVVGVDAFTPSGLYDFRLYDSADSQTPSFQQTLQIKEVLLDVQAIGKADSTARQAEDAILQEIYTTITPDRQWDLEKKFSCPVTTGYQSAGYGYPRSYAGADVSIFHTGVDYAPPMGTPVKAVAGGTVVYSNEMVLRGNIVVIDHGWGVMTGYFHLLERLVAVGDVLTAEQVIGSLGSTGLSTGPHLHLDVRIRNIPVDGAQWITDICPPQ